MTQEDCYFQKVQQEMEVDSQVQFKVHEDCSMRFRDQVCALDNLELKNEIMKEAWWVSNPTD